VTQIDEGQEAQGSTPQVLIFGAPTVGEILADRYELLEHIGNDSLGRQLWRGIDVILRRPVAVVLRYPGGDSAGEMLAAAVSASRIVHPHLAGVYDAIDEGDRAYVVREWVDGSSLRELVADGPFDPDRGALVAAAIADAVAAVHATGMAHGNVHPGTVLVASDGRVVLTDARADEAATPESDVRSIGGVLYCTLTAHWPHTEAGATAVEDGVRDASGTLAAPRQVRGGVPGFLDELTMALLDPTVVPPAAEEVVGELSRFEEQEAPAGLFVTPQKTLGFDSFEPPPPELESRPPAARKIALGVAGLLVIALVGIFGAAQALSNSGSNGKKDPVTHSTGSAQHTQPGQPTALALTGGQVRVVDGKGGDRQELSGADKTVDGSMSTGWNTQDYKPPADFGGLKPGMGLLVNLGSAKKVASVQVWLSAPGATIELRSGNNDPGSSADGDGTVLSRYTVVGDQHVDAPANVILPGASDQPTQYLLIWISKLPSDGKGGFQVGVQEIKVFVL